jgi:hypothetical protein
MDVFALAARQHGVIAVSQIRELGVTPRRQRALLASGVLEVRYPGVLRVAGSPPTWRQALCAATLWLPGALASHRSAAALHRLERAFRRDRRRRRQLELLGWTVLEFTYRELIEEPAMVLSQIATALQLASGGN